MIPFVAATSNQQQLDISTICGICCQMAMRIIRVRNKSSNDDLPSAKCPFYSSVHLGISDFQNELSVLSNQLNMMKLNMFY